MATTRKEPAPDGKCNGTSRTTGERCKQPVKAGFTVCYWHGARGPRAKRGAAERVAMARATSIVGKLKIEPTEDPISELQRIAGETVAIKDYLRKQVERLTSIRYRAETEQTRAELSCYMASLRDCTNVLRSLAQLNLEERGVRIREAQASMIRTAVERTLRDAGFEGESMERARQTLGRHLKVVQWEAEGPSAPGGAMGRDARAKWRSRKPA